MANPAPPKIRRVITGHDDQGRAIVQIDEVCQQDRKSTRLNSVTLESRMPSSA